MIFIYYNISQWSLKNQTLTELSFATAAACRKKKKSCREFTYILTTRLDILFSSNHNIHKSSCGLCFSASDPLIKRF